jgi:hypothetical protein
MNQIAGDKLSRGKEFPDPFTAYPRAYLETKAEVVHRGVGPEFLALSDQGAEGK